MKKFWLLPILLICAMLPLAGCSDDDGDSSDEDVAETAATTTDAADDADADEDAPAEVAEPEDTAAPATEPAVDFASIMPTGLRVIDRFDITGRGTQFTVGCNPVPGAVSYSFSAGFGFAVKVSDPQVSFFRNGFNTFTLDLYVRDAHDTASRHALLYVE